MARLVLYLLLCLPGASLASAPDSPDNNPMEQSGMLRSWFHSKPQFIPRRSSSTFFDIEWGSSDNEADSAAKPKLETAYLKIVAASADPLVFNVYTKCLTTYCKLVIQEKKYTVSDQLMEQLTTFESYSLSSMEEYRLNSNFSSGMNRWLPSRDSRVLWIVRHPFSFRWPTIDMYDDIQKLRAAYPVAADYVDFLFKVTPPSFNIEFLAARARENCKRGVNAVELLTLFALHAFGHGKMYDLNLAKQEAEKLRLSFGATSASTIYQIMDAHDKCLSTGLLFSDDDLAANLLSDGDDDFMSADGL